MCDEYTRKQWEINNLIADANSKYKIKQKVFEYLRKMNHGHKFDYNRQCICGIQQKEYIMIYRDNPDVGCCPSLSNETLKHIKEEIE